MEMILRTSGLATLRDQATLFVLTASDEVSNLPAIAHALEKASLPNIQTADLPVVGHCECSNRIRQLVTDLSKPCYQNVPCCYCQSHAMQLATQYVR